MSPAQHTLFHLPPCPGCLAHKSVLKTEIAPSLTVAEACEQYIKSRSIAGAGPRARYLRKQSLRDLEDYSRPLVRFAAKLRLDQICWENIAEYQIERSAGLLGPSPEELFPVYLKRTVSALAKSPGKSPRKSKEELQNDPQVIELVRAQLSALPQREIGPNKINQEVGMLIRIMKCAGVWTAQLEELYEPLQREESDIPRALSPDEQEFFLRVAQGCQPFIQQYAIVGIDCTLRTKEERELKLGDINLTSSRVLLVRYRSTKNKYGIRTIPLSDQAVWALEHLIERAAQLGSRQPQHYLMPFMEARGIYDPNRPMTVSGIKKPWDEVRGKAGVPWFTPYNLRHTGCTRYAEDGMSIHTLLSMAGHMSPRTQQHYIHISEQAKKRAVQRPSMRIGPRGAAADPHSSKYPASGRS